MSLRGKMLVISYTALSVIIMLPYDVLFLESTGTCLDLSVESGTYRLAFESHEECEMWMKLLKSHGVACTNGHNEVPDEDQSHHVVSQTAGTLSTCVRWLM